MQADGRPDIELSTDQCSSVFLIPNCDNRILVVTTATRPDIWARDGHSPDAFVLDLTNLTSDETHCFLRALAADPQSKTLAAADIIATMKTLATKYALPKPVSDAITKPGGWVGELVFYTVDKLEGTLPCTSS